MGADLADEAHFGPYLIYERLGVGGMATVHRALERGIEGFERTVALKRLLPHLAEDATFIKSFVREARLASLLSHVNIVQIFELGRVGTAYFISMEYVEGKDIRRILRQARNVVGPPPIDVTIGLLMQLCDALDYAHGKVDDAGHPLNLIHRDISPSNVLVTSDGQVKVIDFGIAKAHSPHLRTQTGRVKGKLAYMAPEAIAGKELDSRSDLFAVGVVAHELLTARPLFASKNEYQTLLKVQRGDIMPPSMFNPGSPPELDAIVLKALARDPEERFAHASALRDQLLAVRAQYGLQTEARDIASWLEVAFQPDAPATSGNVSDQLPGTLDVRSPLRPRAVRAPSRRDDDDAGDVWGGRDGDSRENGPVVLDDIPDVSGKVHQVQGTAFDADPRLDSADLPDDLASAAPGIHWARSASSAATEAELAKADAMRPAMRYHRMTGEVPTTSDDSGAFEPSSAPRRKRPPTPATVPDGVPLVEAVPEQSGKTDTSEMPPMHAGLPADSEPRTQPGVVPARAATQSHRLESPDPNAILDASRRKIAANHKPGSSASLSSVHTTRWVRIYQRVRRSRTVLFGITAALAATLAVTLYATRGPDRVPPVNEAPRAPAGAPGTVKFVTEPATAEIVIDGQRKHTGSPWATTLDPGRHQIQISLPGYKAWLTSIDLSPAETSSLRVVLERLSVATPVDASLGRSSSPSGHREPLPPAPAAGSVDAGSPGEPDHELFDFADQSPADHDLGSATITP